MTDEITLTRAEIEIIRALTEANGHSVASETQVIALCRLALKSFDAPPVTPEVVEKVAEAICNAEGVNYGPFRKSYKEWAAEAADSTSIDPEMANNVLEMNGTQARAAIRALSEAGCLKVQPDPAMLIVRQMMEALKCEIKCRRQMGEFVFIETEEALAAANKFLEDKMNKNMKDEI
jgi:hypothetical protein